MQKVRPSQELAFQFAQGWLGWSRREVVATHWSRSLSDKNNILTWWLFSLKRPQLPSEEWCSPGFGPVPECPWECAHRRWMKRRPARNGHAGPKRSNAATNSSLWLTHSCCLRYASNRVESDWLEYLHLILLRYLHWNSRLDCCSHLHFQPHCWQQNSWSFSNWISVAEVQDPIEDSKMNR